jgi:hypothetical protein
VASLGSLVIELAASTARLQGDLGKAVGMAQSAAARFTRIFGGVASLAGASSLGAVVARSIEMGDELNKAAIKAGVGGRAISELAYAARQSDIDLSSLSTALKKMQVALSEAAAGSKAQNKSLSDLGLTIGQLRSLKADQQFELIADRINQIRDPADRARLATELFGKAGADLLPLFEQGAEGIRAAREEAEALGNSFSDEQLKKFAAADDSVKKMTASWQGFAANLTLTVVPAIKGVLDLLSFNVGTAADFQKDKSTDELEALKRRLETGGALTGGEQKTLEFISKELARRRAELGKAVQSVFAPGSSAPAGPSSAAETQTKSAKAALPVMEEWVRRQNAMTDSLGAWIDAKVEDINLRGQYIDALGDEADAMRTLGDLAEQGAEQASKSLTQTATAMTVFAEQASRNMQDALATFLFDPFKDGLKGMLRSFVDTIRQMVAQAAAAKIFGMLGGLGKGGGNSFVSALGSFFGGFKAQGGPVSAGRGYIVGERGPEWFTPGTSGYITPNGSRGATIAPVFHIDARGAQIGVAEQVQRAIAQAAPMIVDASRRAMKDDLSRRAIR